jgi:hypothetical protein
MPRRGVRPQFNPVGTKANEVYEARTVGKLRDGVGKSSRYVILTISELHVKS